MFVSHLNKLISLCDSRQKRVLPPIKFILFCFEGAHFIQFHCLKEAHLSQKRAIATSAGVAGGSEKHCIWGILGVFGNHWQFLRAIMRKYHHGYTWNISFQVHLHILIGHIFEKLYSWGQSTSNCVGFCMCSNLIREQFIKLLHH